MDRFLSASRWLVCFLLLPIIFSCTTAPISGRSQFILISEDQEIALGLKAYQDFLGKAKLSQDAKTNSFVEGVGKNIAAVADKPQYAWEFKVVDDAKVVNAFALPGGKVVVYTGILPYSKDEAGLAFLISHEVGHVIARHGGERISRELVLQLGLEGLNAAIANKSPAAVQGINQAYGVAATLGVLLPFTRSQEVEADRIGLILMAKAGYDPREAPKFFERMMKSDEGKTSVPEFLSTHPADETRLLRLNEFIPEAMKYYQSK